MGLGQDRRGVVEIEGREVEGRADLKGWRRIGMWTKGKRLAGGR